MRLVKENLMRRFAVATLAVATSGLFAGCADKPPGCSDPSTGKLLEELFVKDVVDVVTDNMMRTSAYREDKDHADRMQASLRRYAADVHFTLNQISSDGYESGARRHLCAANVVLETPIEGPKGGNRARFSIQAVEGAKTPLIVVEGYEGLVRWAAADFDTYGARQRAGVPIRQ